MKTNKSIVMKTRNYLVLGTLAIAVAGMVLTGCKKDSTNNSVPTDTTAAQDDANGSFAIQDSKNISDGAAKSQAVDRMLSGCESYRKFDTVIGSQTDTALDIFFGNTDCNCLDGRMRRGHIFVFWNGKWYFDTASTITMTFKNYYVSDIGVTGTRTLTNVNSNTWNFNANLTLTYPSGGGTATWNSSRVNTITTIGSKQYWSVTGTASGTSRKGSTYNITINTPLNITLLPWWLGGCPWIEAGKLTVTVSSFSYPIYVTFGTGAGNCNAQATATIDGNTYNFSQL